MDRNYSEINQFLKSLKSYVGVLTKQQIKTLRGQALSGDVAGANKGLTRIINRRKSANQ